MSNIKENIKKESEEGINDKSLTCFVLTGIITVYIFIALMMWNYPLKSQEQLFEKSYKLKAKLEKK